VSPRGCTLQQLLTSFGSATGLRTNVHKSQVFPINCLEAEVFPVLSQFNATIADFPCQYLGLPLRTGRIQREDEQILIDKVAAKLPRWKGRLLNKVGRLTLINLVLSSIVIHHMTVFQLNKWAYERSTKSATPSCGEVPRQLLVAIAWLIGKGY
jgi:hypothetical protein